MKISVFSRIDLRQLPLAILIFAVLNLTTCSGQGRGMPQQYTQVCFAASDYADVCRFLPLLFVCQRISEIILINICLFIFYFKKNNYLCRVNRKILTNSFLILCLILLFLWLHSS